MSTSNNSISNLITIATFSGQSKYSSDFQTVLTRAVELRSLNLQSMQQHQQTQTDRQTALQALDNKFTALQNAVTNLSNANGLASYAGTVSNPSVASVSLSNGAQAGSYTLEVQSLGSHTQVISNAAVADPSSGNLSAGPFALFVGGGPAVQISPATNTLQGLMAAINGNPSLGVTAAVVNVGNSGQPQYRLSLQASKLGNISIDLEQGSVDQQGNIVSGTPLTSTLVTGTQATYLVNGLSSNGQTNGVQNPITSDSDTITIAPGVTVNLLGTNVGSPVTINVSQNTSAMQTAIQNLATAYNAVVDQLATSYGQNANALQGDSILFSAKAALQGLNGYINGNGSGLSYLGLDLDTSGHLTFNSTEFAASSASGTAPVFTYLGDATQGFIRAANQALKTLQDPVTGLIKGEEQQISTSLTGLGKNISDEVDRINEFQQNLLNQLSQSDAAIFQLQNQTTFFTGLFNYNSKSTN